MYKMPKNDSKYYAELHKYINSHPNPMALKCATCGESYGNHAGWDCQNMYGGQFVLEELKKDNPNTLFRMRK